MIIRPEILKWSATRPAWQQDALRRLVQKSELDALDMAELVLLCKSEAGLDAPGAPTPVPLSAAQVATQAQLRRSVVLTSVGELTGVNNLQPGQVLEIQRNGITVVFGENGTGKSGYVRVLKQLCRVRGGSDPIHGNVYESGSKASTAEIKYEVDGVAASQTWRPGQRGPAELREVSIFDTRAASVYLAEPNEVAYLPEGMDLFPRLVRVVEAVKTSLETEQASLKAQSDRFMDFRREGAVGALLEGLGTPGARARLDALVTLPEDVDGLEAALLSEIGELQSVDTEARAKALVIRSKRLAALCSSLRSAVEALSAERWEQLRQARSRAEVARAAASAATKAAFGDVSMDGIGGDVWRELWESARRFATTANPPRSFPAHEGQQCELCLQPLGPTSAMALSGFERHVRSDTLAQQTVAEEAVDKLLAAAREAVPSSFADPYVLAELEAIAPEASAALAGLIAEVGARASAFVSGQAVMPWSEESIGVLQQIENVAESDRTTAEQLRAELRPQILVDRQTQLSELQARRRLAKEQERVLKQIDREATLAKLSDAISATSTRSISQKNRELLDTEVTKPLADAFADELKALRMTHVPVDLSSSHAEKGRAYHELELGATVDVPVSEVLSEGEHRCISLAAFFAEVSRQDSVSTLVFDDPVSSLDHARRQYVAKRIASLALKRPVLVFTHDLPFLWMLQQEAGKAGVGLVPKHFRRESAGAGRIAESWPWDGMPVSQRANHLRSVDLRLLLKLAAEDREAYEREVRSFYGALRNTWERAVEEVLLNKALRRFQAEVMTGRLEYLHKLTQSHLEQLEAGMTRTSAWIDGHDHALDLGLVVPEPDEVERDLAALESWIRDVKAIHKP